MDDGKIFRIPQPVFPFLNPLPTPLTPPDDAASQVCIMLSRNWLPYVRGAIKLFQYDDIWEFPSEQLKNDGQTLIRQFMTPFSCDIGASNVELQAVDLGGGCQQFQWRLDGGVWMNLGVPVCSGADGLPGADGQDGAPGADGADGLPGECECSDPVPTQPTIPADDRCTQACNIGFGVGSWLHGFFNDSLLLIKAAVEAGDIIADLVGDIIDAFPVLGAVVDAVQDFAVNTIQAGAEETIAANGEYFKEMIQCELFCIMADDTGDFTLAYMGQVRNELIAWAVALPPQTPLLVIIGQIFSLFLLTIPPSEFLRRANVYKDNEGDCELCDCECVECVNPQTNTINCQNGNNNTFIPGDWDVCGAATSYNYDQIAITFPEIIRIKKITVNWRSAFSPSAPIDHGLIFVDGTFYDQVVTGSGNSTSPQSIDDLYVDVDNFVISTTGTENSEHPDGYCAFFSIVVEYCEIPE